MRHERITPAEIERPLKATTGGVAVTVANLARGIGLILVLVGTQIVGSTENQSQICRSKYMTSLTRLHTVRRVEIR